MLSCFSNFQLLEGKSSWLWWKRSHVAAHSRSRRTEIRTELDKGERQIILDWIKLHIARQELEVDKRLDFKFWCIKHHWWHWKGQLCLRLTGQSAFWELWFRQYMDLPKGTKTRKHVQWLLTANRTSITLPSTPDLCSWPVSAASLPVQQWHKAWALKALSLTDSSLRRCKCTQTQMCHPMRGVLWKEDQAAEGHWILILESVWSLLVSVSEVISRRPRKTVYKAPALLPNSSKPSHWAVEHGLKPLTLTYSRKPRVKKFKEKTDSGLSSAHKILGKLNSGHVIPPPGHDAHQQTLGQCWHLGARLFSSITGREELFFERFWFMWQKSKLR